LALSKILLHTCCGPCSTYVVKSLREQGFNVTGYFYNPNIQPLAEYERRLETMKQYVTTVGLELLTPSVSPSEADRHLPLDKGENKWGLRPKDCENCYRVRLLSTAQKAQELGFKFFSTRLLISPYQKIELIKKIGDEIGVEIGVEFFWQDFRCGYRQSQAMAKQLKLYRQKYCGCSPGL